MKRARSLNWLGWVLFIVLILWGVESARAQTIGKLIDKSNWQEYESLLSPAQLRAAQKGEWTFQTGNSRFPYKQWDKFITAGEQNAGKYDIDSTGQLIDKSTGRLPGHNIYGHPFPKIDPKDPNAGTKIMWNLKFNSLHLMGGDGPSHIRWIGKTGREDRYFNAHIYHLYYNGRPPGNEIKRNPDKFLYQYITHIMEPMDLKNTLNMSWEYWDLTDTVVYAYVPVIRRIRRGSGAQRSDPFMGTDIWNDCTDGFSGKIQSFTWKLIGEKTALMQTESIDKRILKEGQDGALTQTYSQKSWF